MMDLIDYCAKHNIDEILELPDIKERVDLYNKYENDFKEQLKRCTTVVGNLLIIDYRNEEIIYPEIDLWFMQCIQNKIFLYMLFGVKINKILYLVQENL